MLAGSRFQFQWGRPGFGGRGREGRPSREPWAASPCALCVPTDPTSGGLGADLGRLSSTEQEEEENRLHSLQRLGADLAPPGKPR